MSKVTVCDHPLIQHKLGVIRNKNCGTKDFRTIVSEIAGLMCYEATRDLKLEDVEIETPITKMTAKQLSGRKLAVVPILRAGLGMVEGMLTPMLATGGSACAALSMLKKHGCRHIRLLDIIAAPEGIARVQREHPDVDIYVCSVDEKLNDHGYIIPGLGDAGDRIFGTK